jgi:hypothetical protein
MVVSPVSLTPEEVELPPGARQKQPTLLGLGAALGVQVPSEYEDVELEPDELDDADAAATPASGPQTGRSLANAANAGKDSPADLPLRGRMSEPPQAGPASGRSVQRRPATASDEGAAVLAPAAEDVGAAVRRLADFALKLSLGPVSRLWVPEIRRATEVLLGIGKQRKEPTLALVSGRLLGLLPIEVAPVAASPHLADTAGPSSAGADGASIAGANDAASDERIERSSAAVESFVSAGTAESSGANEAATDGDALDTGEVAAVAPAERGANSPSEPNPAEQPEAASDSLEGALREQMLHEVTRLAGLLPEWPAAAQDLAQETRRRETRLVRELLESVDGLRRDHRARVTEQMRLEELATLAPELLAEEFETPVERATELSRVLCKYRRSRQSAKPDVGNTLGVERALAELERAQRGFEDCDPERKEVQRALRAERRQAMSGLCLQLAERGELDQLELLEPLSVAERIERMRQWLGAGAERPS